MGRLRIEGDGPGARRLCLDGKIVATYSLMKAEVDGSFFPYWEGGIRGLIKLLEQACGEKVEVEQSSL